MEQNIQNRNQSTLPQLVEVAVPVRAGMSNSLFVLFFVAIFVVGFAVLSYFGLVPEGVREINATLFSTEVNGSQPALGVNNPVVTTSQTEDSLVVSPQLAEQQVLVKPIAPQVQGQVLTYSNEGKSLPTRLIIEKIGIDTLISNPTSQKVSVLDQALLSGGVRYPGSASLEEVGNMLLFGHSSGLKVVHNKAYRAFNDIGKLAIGDEVKVRSSTKEYVYKVTKVSAISADKQLVEFKTTAKMLTLSTCNTFGKKSDRYVVEAQFVRSYPIAN